MEKKLLIIDDAMIIREMIKDAAIADGWEIVGEAANGQEGIEAFQRTNPTATSLDLVMPEFDGRHALRGILETDPQARVLIVSALDQSELLEETLQLGAVEFIVKPFETTQLVSALNRIIDHRGMTPVAAHASASLSH